MTQQQQRRIAIRAGADEREETLAALLELAPDGLEEIELAGGVELAVYGDTVREEQIRARFPGATATTVEPGWADGWRAFHTPVTVGGIWIGPPWEQAPSGPGVVIDPGRAFGTGAHPTTRLCVELLAEAPRGSLLDVGCGSGVLALAAARLGYGPIVAVDDDPVAVETTRANARANGVALDAHLLDALRGELPAAGVAVANVLLAPVEAILARLDADIAVTSGYLEGEVPAHPGWRRASTRVLEGWAADRFERVRGAGADDLPPSASV